MQAAVKTLTGMRFLQSAHLDFPCPCEMKTDLHVSEQVFLALRGLLLKVLPPHLRDPAANMAEVYDIGLPVFLRCLSDDLSNAGGLGGLLEGLLDRMVMQQDWEELDVDSLSKGLLPAISELVDAMRESSGDGTRTLALCHTAMLVLTG